MEDEKVINFINRIKVNKEDSEKEKKIKGKIDNFRLHDNMKKRIEKLKTEYTKEKLGTEEFAEDVIIGIAASEFSEKYNGNIETVEYEKLEEMAKEILNELKIEEKGNER